MISLVRRLPDVSLYWLVAALGFVAPMAARRALLAARAEIWRRENTDMRDCW